MTEIHPVAQPTFLPCPQPRKAAYERMSSALRAADKLAARFEVTPYLCDCGRYHLTSKGGRNEHSKKSKKGRRHQ